jgi:hypothetical protein
MKGNRVVILQKDKPPSQYLYEDRRLSPAEPGDSALQEEALAHAVWSMNTYEQRGYRLPD